MDAQDRAFLREFFNRLRDTPLEPDDPRYVSFYEELGVSDDDPVELLARAVEWTPSQSVQLFSGFRGSGKSTELRRLRRRLQAGGFVVLLFDIEDYVNTSTPIDVSDFLMAVAGGAGEEVKQVLGRYPGDRSYWERLRDFLTRTRVEAPEMTLSVGGGTPAGVELKANLRSDPTFKAQLQQRMAGHLGAFVDDVRRYFAEIATDVQEHREGLAGVVLVVDSLEHIRGTSVNAEEVQSSLETLIAAHAEKLHFPGLHVIYTVPPWLKVRYPNLGALYEPGGVVVLPALKVCGREGARPYQRGLDALERVVAARGDWKRLLAERRTLDQLVTLSGGHLRDLLRLIAEIIRRSTTLPAASGVVDRAISQIRSEALPIADADASWLRVVSRTKRAELDDVSRLPDLARFLDTHLMLCYRNGEEWYDVHPLIRDEVLSQARGNDEDD